MSPLRLLWRSLVAVALFAALGAAAALVVAPQLLAPVQGALTPAFDAVAEIETDRLLLSGVALIGLMAVLVVLRRTLSGSDDEPVLVADGRRPPESTSVDPATVSGYAVDEALAGVDSLDEARDRRRELQETAIAALRAAGADAADAERRIEHGAWTDDDLAAGFLGDAVPVPLLARLRGWLDGRSEGRRRLVRSIDAIDALAAAPDAVVRTPVERAEETDE